MGIEAGVVARLNAVAAVTSLVSNRIFADVLPDGTTHPAIVYQLISTVPFDSNLNSDGDLRVSRVQFTLIDDTKSGMIALSDAVETALKRFQGSVGGIEFVDSRLENNFDQAYDLETDRVARLMDFLIYYR